MKRTLAWQKAKEAGRMLYDSEVPCRRCGGQLRYVSSVACKACLGEAKWGNEGRLTQLARVALGFTKVEMAKRMGVDARTLRDWEGGVCRPKVERIWRELGLTARVGEWPELSQLARKVLEGEELR